MKGCLISSPLNGKSRTLLVHDDLLTVTDDRVVDLFTKISRHRNLSVVYLTQNIFQKNKQSISLNSHYLVLLTRKSSIEAGMRRIPIYYST